jgi:hypothetical protein
MGPPHGTWRRCGSGFEPWGTRRLAHGARGAEQKRIIQACLGEQPETRDTVRSVPHDNCLRIEHILPSRSSILRIILDFGWET